MKTRIYIDGYNLYYGCLKGSPYKWLNLVQLFEKHILPSKAPANSQLIDKGIKYFTADISEKAAKTPNSVSEQQAYLLALSTLSTHIEIIKGYYSINKVPSHLTDYYHSNKFPKDCQKVETWKLEEKQSDVNLAVEALYDALTIPDLEQIVFVTNDTDLVPAVKKIKKHNKKIILGLVIPTQKGKRPPNTELSTQVDWVREHISCQELQHSQFPRVVQTNRRKDAIKPESWFGQPKILEQIMTELLSVYDKRNKCWQWLETEKPNNDGLPKLKARPINLLNDQNSAMDVLKHAKAYVKYQLTNK